jgi:hypothetical protein
MAACKKNGNSEQELVLTADHSVAISGKQEMGPFLMSLGFK